MKIITKYAAGMALAVAMIGCADGNETSDGNVTSTDSVPTQLATQPDVEVVSGVAVDGSHRNIYIESQGDTLDYELPPATDFTWNVGDSVRVELKHDDQGNDIVTSIKNLSGN